MGERVAKHGEGKVILEKSRALRGGRELDALSLGERGRAFPKKLKKEGGGRRERERERGKEGEEGLGEVGLW